MAGEKQPAEDSKQSRRDLFPGAGGTPGGFGLFAIGFLLAAGGVYLLLDSVDATTGDVGLFSGFMYRGLGGGPWMTTTSMGVLFVPFFMGVAILFYNSRLQAGWWLMYGGLAVIVIEILSHVRFIFRMKTSLLLLMLAMIAAGVGLMVRSFRDESVQGRERKDEGRGPEGKSGRDG